MVTISGCNIVQYDDQEIEVKRVTDKLRKLRGKYAEIKEEIADAQTELQQERNGSSFFIVLIV